MASVRLNIHAGGHIFNKKLVGGFFTRQRVVAHLTYKKQKKKNKYDLNI